MYGFSPPYSLTKRNSEFVYTGCWHFDNNGAMMMFSLTMVDYSKSFLSLLQTNRGCHSKTFSGVGARVYVVAHRSLVSAPVPLGLIESLNKLGLGWG